MTLLCQMPLQWWMSIWPLSCTTREYSKSSNAVNPRWVNISLHSPTNLWTFVLSCEHSINVIISVGISRQWNSSWRHQAVTHLCLRWLRPTPRQTLFVWRWRMLRIELISVEYVSLLNEMFFLWISSHVVCIVFARNFRMLLCHITQFILIVLNKINFIVSFDFVFIAN